jgi:hypothetical protein
MTKTFLTLSLLAGLSALAEDEPMDAVLETSAGQALRLRELWKKPTVLFYEDATRRS